MIEPVLTALLPVVLLIAAGYLAGSRGWVGKGSVKDLSNLVFLLLAPALLFRTMAGVRVHELQLAPLASYFTAAGLIFFLTLALGGWHRAGAVVALAATFSNTVMIGIPLVGLAWGEAGLRHLLTLVSVHALVMLTLATVVLEMAVQRERERERAKAPAGAPSAGLAASLARALRNAVIHPVPLPILAGLAYSLTGWGLPGPVDRPLQWLGTAFGPLALLLVGITLSHTSVGPHWRGALAIAAAKNLLHPVLVLAIGWALGQGGLPLAVMVVAASLPVGANVFLFSQRYEVAQELVTAAVAVSAGVALVSLSVAMAVAQALLT